MRQNVKYCGNTTPHRFDSSRNTLEIRFKSDGENGGRGFKLQYSLQSKLYLTLRVSRTSSLGSQTPQHSMIIIRLAFITSCLPSYMILCIMLLQIYLGCNTTYTENSGRIFSPQWPYSSPSNTICEFVINVADSRTISVYPRAFHVRSGANCSSSYLEVTQKTRV